MGKRNDISETCMVINFWFSKLKFPGILNNLVEFQDNLVVKEKLKLDLILNVN